MYTLWAILLSIKENKKKILFHYVSWLHLYLMKLESLFDCCEVVYLWSVQLDSGNIPGLKFIWKISTNHFAQSFQSCLPCLPHLFDKKEEFIDQKPEQFPFSVSERPWKQSCRVIPVLWKKMQWRQTPSFYIPSDSPLTKINEDNSKSSS